MLDNDYLLYYNTLNIISMLNTKNMPKLIKIKDKNYNCFLKNYNILKINITQ